MSTGSRGHQWIAHRQPGKSVEISIRGPEFADAVMQTERHDARIVDERSLQSRRCRLVPQLVEVTLAFADQIKIAPGKPGIDRAERGNDRRRLLEYPGMGDDAHEFMHAGPGNRPRCGTAAQSLDQLMGSVMIGAVGAMGIHEQVRVHRDHVPRPP